MLSREPLPARDESPLDRDTLASEIPSLVRKLVARDRRLRALPAEDERDIVQVVCVRLLGRMEGVGVRGSRHAQALLRLMTASALADLIRKRRRGHNFIQIGGLGDLGVQEERARRGIRLLGASSVEERTALACVIATETVRRIACALRKLGTLPRRVFLRSVIRRESFAAIGARYRMSRATTRRLFAAAQQQLGVLLSELRERSKAISRSTNGSS